ncbi:MAG: 3-dehydroquinate synthase [Chloroflexi bacterium]|nr:3-dehydroquinate synthase [Chloroflexota bacterium]
MTDNLFLIGFSTTGKSTVGRLAAESLGYAFLDTDDLVERMVGRSVPDIFARDGEPAFRELERRALAQASERGRAVVATGGGIILDEQNRRLMAERGIVVLLEARPATIFARLRAALTADGPGAVRPLLQSPDPLARIESLKAARQPLYCLAADWTVHTDGLALEQVAAEVTRGFRRVCAARGIPHPGPKQPGRRTADCRRERRAADQETRPAVHGGSVAGPSRSPAEGAGERQAAGMNGGSMTTETWPSVVATVETSSASYPVVVGEGVLADLGDLMARVGLRGRAFVVADRNAFQAHGVALLAGLTAGEFKSAHFLAEPGEDLKSLATAERVYDWLVGERAERLDPVVAFGGGVVGDLAGFVAATYLRGVPVVQVPTTLLAMVDASTGGKTGVNHSRGKNLIGAFHQPRLVLGDVGTLTSLPARELTSGWAEVIKAAAIEDPLLFADLEAGVEVFRRLGAGTAGVIGRSVAIKARIVSEDERETGRRILLNYGHTIAHGIEAATGYGRYLHGEAVAIGIVGATGIARRIGILAESDVERQRDLLQRFGLPDRAPGISPAAIAAAMKLDKKVRQAVIRWVLLEGIGRPVVRSDVPEEVVADAVAETVEEVVR